MAYASIAGFNPVAGLYAGVVPAIVGSLTSRTVLMVTTLTSAIALTSQSVLSDAGLDPKDAGIAAVPAALPSFTAPDLSAVPDLIGGAFSVALVALAQAAGVAPSMPNPDGSRSDVNGDFRAQGYANLLGGLFQSLPSGGSMSRTGGVAVSAGARTRWAGVCSGVFLALVVLVCGSLAERIPMPVIGGLILVVGGELVWGKRHDIMLVLRTSWLSSAAMILTFLATTQLPLQRAVVLGAVLSLLLYCAQAARQARLVALHRDPDGAWRTVELPKRLPPGEVTRPRLRGHLLLRRTPPRRGPAAVRRRRPRRRSQAMTFCGTRSA
jgi:SulP family sulfate permease